ncbi:Phthiodiolone/phenolphthiodiolone dimycocerosates ketoreductase [subsurface metagenome]|jgi:alkanesulfonate monooxygenase SsuD/methylene tetrahydromethanopterin reductase-like flavin-dependent oxidoreductase (luciferase family)
MKFSFHIPVPTPRLEYMFEGTKKAEECGFFGVFYADHTVMLPPGPGTCYDAYCFLTSLAMITKKIKLCTGVSDCHRFHPALMAHKVATLDQISNGRGMIGLGAGEAMNIDMYGLNRNKSVSKLREYIILLREFWTKRRVNRKSEFWGEIKKAYIQIKPVQKNPPIYIAANGPKTRQLTGELANGWYPLYQPPWLYKEKKKEVFNAAKAVGRSPSEIDYVYDCFVAIDNEDPDNALKRCEFFKSTYLLNSFITNEAYPGLNLPEDINVHDFEMSNLKSLEYLNNLDRLPETILQDTNCLGTVDDVISSIEKYKQAGATHMSLMNRGPDTNKVYEIFRDKIIPYFKELEK